LLITALDSAYEMPEDPHEMLFHSGQDGQYGGRNVHQQLGASDNSKQEQPYPLEETLANDLIALIDLLISN
jgi:hypothetical protein